MRSESSSDPTPVPGFLSDPEVIAPCPCGFPISEGAMMIEGSTSLARWFHPECLDFLRYEMDDEEVEEMEKWQEENL